MFLSMQQQLKNKIIKLLKPRFSDIKVLGSLAEDKGDEFSDVDLEVYTDKPLADLRDIKDMLGADKTYVFGYPIPFFRDKVIYSSFWKIESRPYSADISLVPRKRINRDLSKIEADEYLRFCGLSWHGFVAFERKDLIELAIIMGYLRELHLYPLIKKAKKLETFKDSKKLLDQETYRKILATFCYFENIDEVEATYKMLICFVRDLYRRESNFVLDYICEKLVSSR